MKYSELEKLLRKAGCEIRREGASHTQWYSPITHAYFMVGRHKTEEVRIGTLNAILKQAGLK